MRVTTTRDTVLKTNATTALPRHDRETLKNAFSCSSFGFTPLASVKLSLSQDLIMFLDHLKMLFFSLVISHEAMTVGKIRNETMKRRPGLD